MQTRTRRHSSQLARRCAWVLAVVAWPALLAAAPPEPKSPSILDLPPPNPLEIGGVRVTDLLDSQGTKGVLGSFKLVLPRQGIQLTLHGIADLRFAVQQKDDPAGLRSTLSNSPASFGADFRVLVGADLRDRIFAELQVAYDAEQQAVGVDYAQLDIRAYRDFLFVRGGKFRVPIGGLNIYPDPTYVFKLPELPLFYGQVLPGPWSEVGVELHGRYSWAEGRSFSYAFYAVNGLEQKQRQPTDPVEGGLLYRMRDNLTDSFDGDKGFGGQLQVEPVPGVSLGGAAYSGVYTVREGRRLSLVDFHFGYQRRRLTLRAELAVALQEVTRDTLVKSGGYALFSYRFLPYWEPVLMLDFLRVAGAPQFDRITSTFGMIFYPVPQKVPSAALRVAFAPNLDGNGGFANFRFTALANVGF